MAETYRQIQRQIEFLQRRAEMLKASEVAGVIERIKVAIDHYELTAEQLGLAGKAMTLRGTPTGKRRTGEADARSGMVKYSDNKGNVWGGRGPRPQWLRQALGSGRSLQEFATPSAASSSPVGPSRKAGGSKRRKAKNQYRDPQSGNFWSGMGPQPRWLREAIHQGASLQDFAVKN